MHHDFLSCDLKPKALQMYLDHRDDGTVFYLLIIPFLQYHQLNGLLVVNSLMYSDKIYSHVFSQM